MHKCRFGALGFVLAVVFATSPVRAADPSLETCIAYAEADAAYIDAEEMASAATQPSFDRMMEAYHGAIVAADAQYRTAFRAAASDEARSAADDARRAAYARATLAKNVADQQIHAQLRAAMTEASRRHERAYEETYDGPTSGVPSVMSRLIGVHRTRCRDLYGL